MSDLDYLSASVGIYFAIICAQAVCANRAYDPRTLLGARDDFNPDDKYLLRARRTLANMTEAMVMHAPLVLIAFQTNSSSALTLLGSALFFWARLLYAVVYIAGVPVVRSIFWGGGLIGTALVFWEVAPFTE